MQPRSNPSSTALLRSSSEGDTLGRQKVIQAEVTEDVEPREANRITPLEQFMNRRGLKPAHVARESGYSRQHLLRIRMGRMEPTRRCMAAIIAAVRRLTREPIMAGELFHLEDEEDIRREVMSSETSSRHARQASSRSEPKLPTRRFVERTKS